jgi:hypothetical protein
MQIDIYHLITGAGTTYALLLIVFLLMYIAFWKDKIPERSNKKRN